MVVAEFVAGCAILFVTISSSGGIAGRGAFPGQKTVKVEDLGRPIRDFVCSNFSADRLAALAGSGGKSVGADRFEYHIIVTEDDGKIAKFDIPESRLTAEMLDFIDEI